MGSLTIRKLDDGVKTRLRLAAAARGVSMEEEARRLLAASLTGVAGAGISAREILERAKALPREKPLDPRYEAMTQKDLADAIWSESGDL